MFDRRYDLLYKSLDYLYLIRVFNTKMSSYFIFLNLLRGKKRALKIQRIEKPKWVLVRNLKATALKMASRSINL